MLCALLLSVTLNEAVETALAKHPSYAAAQAATDAAHESIGIAEAAYRPIVTAGAAYRRFRTHAFLPAGLPLAIGPVIGPIDDWSAGVDVRYTLYDHGARRSELAGARAVHASVSASADATRDAVVFAVHDAFNRLAAAQATRKAAAEQVERADAHVGLSQARLDAGAVPPVDVLRAKTSAANARLALTNADAAVEIAKGALNAAMGLPAESPLEIDTSSGNVPDDVDVNGAIVRALDRRADARAARERESLQRSRINLAASAAGPKARVAAGYGVRDSEVLPDDPDWYAGVTLDIPILDGGATKHRIAAARSELRRQEAETAAILNAIRQEVWSAGTTLRQRREAVRAAEAAQREAAEAARLATARYEAGAGTINDLLDAETALLQAEVSVVRARFEEQIAFAAFRRAAGDF